MKHSFYPSEEIEAKLREEASRTKRTIRQTVSDIVEAYYQEKERKSEEQTISKELINAQEQISIFVSEGISDILLANGLKYEDNRPKSGKLWVYDSLNAKQILQQIESRFGVKFIYVEHGGKATNGKSSWYMK